MNDRFIVRSYLIGPLPRMTQPLASNVVRAVRATATSADTTFVIFRGRPEGGDPPLLSGWDTLAVVTASRRFGKAPYESVVGIADSEAVLSDVLSANWSLTVDEALMFFNAPRSSADAVISSFDDDWGQSGFAERKMLAVADPVFGKALHGSHIRAVTRKILCAEPWLSLTDATITEERTHPKDASYT